MNLSQSDAPTPTRAPADDDLLSEKQARAEVLPLSLAWYRRQRWTRKGPPYLRVSGRIFYERAALKRWISEQQQVPEA